MISRTPIRSAAIDSSFDAGLDTDASESVQFEERVLPQISSKKILLQRQEFKYVVDRSTRTALRRDLLAIMQPDEYAKSNGTYLVRSLYFDTPNFRAYQEKTDGAAIRHKLRVRAYGDDPSQASLVRLEVKSRYLKFIHKTVVDISRESYPEIERSFRERILPPEWLINASGVSQEFFRIQRQWGQEPKVLIQYRREAFERRELGRIRVNFDDELAASRSVELLAPLHAPRRIMRYGHAVFEIKVDGVVPNWLHMLIGKYNLQNQAFSKYCHGLRSIGRISSEIREHELS